MPKKNPLIRIFEGQRFRYESSRSVDDILSDLRKRVGQATADRTAREKFAAKSSAELERHAQSFAGDSGFMLFDEIDHSEWLAAYGVRRKVIRWIFGNPAIAYTMLRHDITAGLFAPVEILLFDSEAGSGSTIVYDLPSSLMAIDANSPLLEAAEALDKKLADLIEGVI